MYQLLAQITKQHAQTQGHASFPHTSAIFLTTVKTAGMNRIVVSAFKFGFLIYGFSLVCILIKQLNFAFF